MEQLPRPAPPPSVRRGRIELASFGASAVVAAVAAVVLLPMLAFAVLGNLLGDPRPEQIAFDPHGWSAPDVWNSDIRARMVDDLRENYLPAGTTREEVVVLLGAPPNSAGTADTWTYRLRDRAGYGPAAEYLLIRFDSDGRIKTTDVFAQTE